MSGATVQMHGSWRVEINLQIDANQFFFSHPNVDNTNESVFFLIGDYVTVSDMVDCDNL